MYNDYHDNQAHPIPEHPHHPVDRGLRLAEAYVPDQKYMTAFPPAEALAQGTLFPELVRPYVNKR